MAQILACARTRSMFCAMTARTMQTQSHTLMPSSRAAVMTASRRVQSAGSGLATSTPARALRRIVMHMSVRRLGVLEMYS
jgi:hypothetical protein